MIATANAFVESSSTVPGAQMFDPHDVIPDPTPHQISLLHEILYGLSPFDPPLEGNFSTTHRKPRTTTVVYEHGTSQEADVDAKENYGGFGCV